MKLRADQILKDLLEDKYLELKRRNSRYSLRAFAKKINVSPAALSEIMSLKRRVSIRKAFDLLTPLNIAPEALENLAKQYDPNLSLDALAKLRNEAVEIILNKNHHLVADWRYPAVFSLIRMENFNPQPSRLARKLGLKVTEVTKILSELFDLDLIFKDQNGRTQARRVVFRNDEQTPPEVGSAAKINALKGGIRAIQKKAHGEYAFTSVGAYDPDKLKDALMIIEDFVKKLSIYMSSGKTTDIFQLVVQVYPRSKIDKKS
ncbi:MAG: DUF4423 domain-containing protein [Bdellovibrionales bacterium]